MVELNSGLEEREEETLLLTGQVRWEYFQRAYSWNCHNCRKLNDSLISLGGESNGGAGGSREAGGWDAERGRCSSGADWEDDPGETIWQGRVQKKTGHWLKALAKVVDMSREGWHPHNQKGNPGLTIFTTCWTLRIFKRQLELKLVKEEGEIQEWVEDLKKGSLNLTSPPPDDSLNLGAGQFETESRHQEEWLLSVAHGKELRGKETVSEDNRVGKKNLSERTNF